MVKFLPRRAAFTLIELLVVIAIIGILATLIISVTGTSRFISQRVACLNNMRQIAVAFQLYAGENDQQLPSRVNTGQGDKWPRLLYSYLKSSKVYLAPGIDTVTPDLDTLLSNNNNNTSFIMNGYNDLGAYNDPDVVIRTLTIAEPARTILLGMPKARDANFYMDVVENNQTQVLNLTAYGEGSNYVFADGSARFIKKDDHDLKMWFVNKDYVPPVFQ